MKIKSQDNILERAIIVIIILVYQKKRKIEMSSDKFIEAIVIGCGISGLATSRWLKVKHYFALLFLIIKTKFLL